MRHHEHHQEDHHHQLQQDGNDLDDDNDIDHDVDILKMISKTTDGACSKRTHLRPFRQLEPSNENRGMAGKVMQVVPPT
ncbi:unnamed protein product [Dibothriocephalus latus]|uniref:Uncharacterized protein n=1 Tax=Dibothriocephalus latus TaxID=60516 RepID=A0A3P7LFP7_DIBLA|nr:unnamed protein product [Dibothriocephalus latus]